MKGATAMWCAQRPAEPADAVEPAEPPPGARDERVDDTVRQEAAEELGAAYADGLLTVAELESALERAYAARTGGDLAVALAAVPHPWRAQRAEAARRERQEAARRAGHRRAVATYAAVMALLVVLWAVSALRGGADHPWFVWPLLGWGIPLLAGRPGSSRP